ncbi:hypothetical protein [Salinicola tamaricis]|uniref:hypothetical protein n=1 Tax=Salinicola tamaricis TaxID=1771309 RepID=UPI001A90FA9C|nr:hypothetical protein [Salinicola tamaricis]
MLDSPSPPTGTGPAYVGCGAGFAGDRPRAAVALVEALAACDGPRYCSSSCSPNAPWPRRSYAD